MMWLFDKLATTEYCCLRLAGGIVVPDGGGRGVAVAGEK
jgi:hypothetical protein